MNGIQDAEAIRGYVEMSVSSEEQPHEKARRAAQQGLGKHGREPGTSRLLDAGHWDQRGTRLPGHMMTVESSSGHKSDAATVSVDGCASYLFSRTRQ